MTYFRLLTNTLIIGEWVFLASQTVLRWATSPGEPHIRGESPCRARSTSRAARTAKANAEGSAQRHCLATSQWSRRGGV